VQSATKVFAVRSLRHRSEVLIGLSDFEKVEAGEAPFTPPKGTDAGAMDLDDRSTASSRRTSV
jgi:hypothetical protein